MREQNIMESVEKDWENEKGANFAQYRKKMKERNIVHSTHTPPHIKRWMIN